MLPSYFCLIYILVLRVKRSGGEASVTAWLLINTLLRYFLFFFTEEIYMEV